MTVGKKEFIEVLSKSNEDLLREVLTQSGMEVSETETAESMAEKLGEELWWYTTSPADRIFSSQDLDGMVQEVADKLDLEVKSQEGWSSLRELTDLLVPQETEVRVRKLPDDLKERLKKSKAALWTGSGTAGTSMATHFGAKWLLKISAGLKWIRFLPTIGPVFIGLRTALGVIATVSGPLSIAIGLWTLNKSFGPRLDKALPLLLGAGLAVRIMHPEGLMTIHEE